MPDVKLKLLIVDDEIALRASLSQIFAELHYTVRTAENGLCALRDIENEIPDVLLSDLNMPVMSGFDLLAEVRRRFSAIRVIAMSGAYSGVQIPYGVIADAFYEKGTGVVSLLEIMTTVTHRERPTGETSRSHLSSLSSQIAR
jgi:CheY-like chemotaxis protein